jgi:FtsH-binding integral membrane protein
VFGLLAAQLLLTAAIAAPIVLHPAIKSFVASSGVVVGLACITSLVLILVLTFNEQARRSHPTNLILLAAFTTAEGVLTGAITSTYDLQVVVLAVSMTAAITIGLSLYALNTKKDFTMQGGMLCTLLLTLILTGALAAFSRSSVLHVMMAGAGTLLFGFYIVYDVQLIAGGKHTAVQLSTDEYVMGAIQVYLDIINLMMHLLHLISELTKDR